MMQKGIYKIYYPLFFLVNRSCVCALVGATKRRSTSTMSLLSPFAPFQLSRCPCHPSFVYVEWVRKQVSLFFGLFLLLISC
mmetsp:Transcript_15066/g.17160  ORF Transcript_15066/g.17160 Transcript_15066/m.17160 type:complete len:81 (-) Transcript_15066:33-275(-)